MRAFFSILRQGEKDEEGVKALLPADVATVQAIKDALEVRSQAFAVVLPLDGNHPFFVDLNESFGSVAKLNEAVTHELEGCGAGNVEFIIHARGVAPMIGKGNLK